MRVDTLIEARWVIPVDQEGVVLEQYAVAVNDGRVVALLPRHQAAEQISASHRLHLPSHALLPGLINAHTHTPMTLFRGLADDLPLMTWLSEHIWPAEQRWVHEEFVADGSRLAIAEMIRGGTTCFNDMYFFPDVTARVAAQAGMRSAIGMILIDFPSAWASDTNEYLSKAIEVHDHFKGDPLIHPLFAPHAPYSVSDNALNKMKTLANELDLPIHMHIHETAEEVRQGVRDFAMRPLARLDKLGLLSPSLIAVHMTQLNQEEIDRVAAAGCQVVHCPESNLKLASGFCPVESLVSAGVNVALGTDGAASNNDLDMLGELRSAALLSKGVTGNASSLPAYQALKMATLNGAKALGLDHLMGSLTPGKAADMIGIDLGQPETQPVYDPISQIVYAATRHQVSDVWIAGQRLLKETRMRGPTMPQLLTVPEMFSWSLVAILECRQTTRGSGMA